MPVRSRLISPVPQPKVITGGHFLTLDTLGGVVQRPLAGGAAAAGSEHSESPPSQGDIEEEGPPVTRSQSTTPQSPKRAAAPVDRFGLIHVVSVHHTVPIPAELQKLPYAAVVLEILGEDFADGGNTFLQRMIIAGIPMLIVGKSVDVDDALRFVRKVEEAASMTLQKNTVELCRPAAVNANIAYRFVAHKMVLVTSVPLPFKVCLL